MTPRHALQAAAKQFGNDGTDRSLSELLTALLTYQHSETPWMYDAGTFKVHGVRAATLTDESHSEVGT